MEDAGSSFVNKISFRRARTRTRNRKKNFSKLLAVYPNARFLHGESCHFDLPYVFLNGSYVDRPSFWNDPYQRISAIAKSSLVAEENRLIFGEA